MTDLPGLAILNYYFDPEIRSKLWVLNKYGHKEEMKISTYFRRYGEMSIMDQIALGECRGSVLDIGAAAGSHALALQERGFAVTALDVSDASVMVMQQRGVKNAIRADIFSFRGKKFDTLLLLMNGIGLVENMDGLHRFLELAKALMKKNAQIIFDSSDVGYLYNRKFKKPAHYYGEIEYQYAYKRIKTDWFSWLYIDQHTMKKAAHEHGYHFQILFEDDEDQYLAKLAIGDW